MSHPQKRLNRRGHSRAHVVIATTSLCLTASIVSHVALAPVVGASPVPPSVMHVSDLRPLSTHGGWGPVEFDRSNGERGDHDGGTLRIAGRSFAKGVGAHAGSEVTYAVPEGCTSFRSVIGVDDEVGRRGSVQFQVYEESRRIFSSRRLTGRSGEQSLSLGVTPGSTLRLVVTDAGDGPAFDHADWADARFSCADDTARKALASAAEERREEAVDTAEAAPSTAYVVAEEFTGADGEFVSSRSFWSSEDRGTSQNATWFSESGEMLRRDQTGNARADYFRMWTRQNDLRHVEAELDVTFNGFVSGSAGWHGVNLWLHKQMCTPVPSCSAVKDPGSAMGNSGYALDFMNRDGSMTILKKVSGDTRRRYGGAVSHAQGGTYYQLAQTSFRPTAGQRYRFTGRSVDNGDGSTTLQVLVDGQLRLSVRDDKGVGGPRLGPGRVGLRSDYVDMTVDNFVIRD